MIRRIAGVSVLALAVACSPDTRIVPTTFEIGLALGSIAMRAGDSILPSVTVTVDGVRRTPNFREVVVSSSDTSVIAIASNGALLAVGRGQANITVAWAATSSITAMQPVSVISETLTGVSLVAPVNLIPGDTATFAVTGTIRGGRHLPSPASVEVISRNPAIVSASGTQIVAIVPGATWIVATASTGVSDSALVTVAVGPPTHLTLLPHIAQLVAGETLPVTVAMTDRRGNVVTTAPSFATTASSVATVQPNATILAVGAGSALIVASAGDAADTLHLTVLAPPLARLVVLPDSIMLAPGNSRQIQVQATDALEHAMPLPALTWQSLTNGITVSSAGLIQASASIVSTIANGIVQVSSGSITAQVRVVVIPAAPVLGTLVVWPDTVTLTPGGTASITVQAIDTHGNTMAVPALTWQSLTNGISVSSAGLVQASSSIVATIPNGVVRVTSGVVVAQVRVAVVYTPPPPPPPTDAGYVQVRWIGSAPSASVAAAFEAARLKINNVFKSFAGVTPGNLNIPAGACAGSEPALGETVPGILIYAQVTTIDGAGGILGSAGPCLIRNVTFLPVLGSMQFDVADMAAMATNGTLNGVVMHEMMHVLGFGTIWGPGLKAEVASPNGADPRFIGTNGQAGYAAVGGLDGASGVPVENTGGSGTRGSHWRESVFHSELMTGWADGALAMSRATIGALKDFGYDVDVNKADPFNLGSSLLGGASLISTMPISERMLKPLGVVGPDGRITPYAGPTGN